MAYRKYFTPIALTQVEMLHLVRKQYVAGDAEAQSVMYESTQEPDSNQYCIQGTKFVDYLADF